MAFLVEGFVCLFETHCTASSAVLRNSALTVANRRLQAYFATFRLTSLHSGLLRDIQAYFATFRLTSRHSGFQATNSRLVQSTDAVLNLAS